VVAHPSFAARGDVPIVVLLNKLDVFQKTIVTTNFAVCLAAVSTHDCAVAVRAIEAEIRSVVRVRRRTFLRIVTSCAIQKVMVGEVFNSFVKMLINVNLERSGFRASFSDFDVRSRLSLSVQRTRFSVVKLVRGPSARSLNSRGNGSGP
jgi:hypothetical protein